MKEYMMIFIGEDYGDLDMSPQDIGARIERWGAWVGRLTQEGLFVDGRALSKPAKTLRPDDVVTDGPYVESKEVVGGYFIVKAESMEQAVEMSKGYPDFDLGGGVEVREIMVYE